MSEIAVRVDNLGKCYVIDHRQSTAGYKTLRETVMGLVRLRNASTTREHFGQCAIYILKSTKAKSSEWLEVMAQVVLTFLKLLSRITPPSTGRIEFSGRVSSLLEVGTGFHPELSGRENIFLNGAILGMGAMRSVDRFDEIVGLLRSKGNFSIRLSNATVSGCICD